MLQSTPLISVIIPAYNAEKFIAKTLDSVISQTHKNLEIIVIDDGSVDSTRDIVLSYSEKDPRISIVDQTNKGVAAARNLGIQKAKGEFVAPIDADDIWFNDYLEALLPLMKESIVGMVYAWSVLIDEDGDLIRLCQSSIWQGNDCIPLIYRNLLGNSSCALMRLSSVIEIGGYDPSFRDLNAQGCEDWDIYIRLAQSFEVRVVPRLLVGYRQVEGSMSNNPAPMDRAVNLILSRLAEKYPEIDPSIYAWNRSNFALYLAGKCRGVGNHRQALFYMRQALCLDYFPLMKRSFYKMAIGSVLKILFYPITTLIWPDHQAWLNFKKHWTDFVRARNPFYQEITLAHLQQQQMIAKQNISWLEKIIESRCDRIRRQNPKLPICSISSQLSVIEPAEEVEVILNITDSDAPYYM